MGEFIHWLEHRWKRAGGAVILLLLIAYALSGIIRIKPDELAVLTRFGRPVEDLDLASMPCTSCATRGRSCWRSHEITRIR